MPEPSGTQPWHSYMGAVLGATPSPGGSMLAACVCKAGFVLPPFPQCLRPHTSGAAPLLHPGHLWCLPHYFT